MRPGFSGSDDGECVLVARFDTPRQAHALLTELYADYVPSAPYTNAWRSLFHAEEVDTPTMADALAPATLEVLGATLMARTARAPGDDFPELRALAWKRGAVVRGGGVHQRAPSDLLFAIRARDGRDAARTVARAPAGEMTLVVQHDVVLGAVPLATADATAAVRALAGARPLAATLMAGEVAAEELLMLVHALDAPFATTPRLFAEHGDAPALAASIGPDARLAGRHVVLEATGDALVRAGLVAQRAGAVVTPLVGRRVVLRARPWRPDLEPIAAADLAAFATASGAGSERDTTDLVIETETPEVVLATLPSLADERGWRLALTVDEAAPLEAAVRALLAEARAR